MIKKNVDKEILQMKEYLKKLKRMISKYDKAQVAVKLGVTDTRTIDQWIHRELIPAKYLDKLKEMK